MRKNKNLPAIQDALCVLWHPSLDFVFPNEKILKKVNIVAYDREKFYLWTYNEKNSEISPEENHSQYKTQIFEHRIKLNEELFQGWHSTIPNDEMKHFFKENISEKEQVICGPTASLFQKKHRLLKKQRIWPDDPYITRESYMSTIIHEFGHCYCLLASRNTTSSHQIIRKHLLDAYRFFRSSRRGYTTEKKPQLFYPKTSPPLREFQSEVFAFCAEYTAADLFWPEHRKNLDQYFSRSIKELLDADLPPNLLRNWHTLAAVVGKLLFHKHNRRWPQFITTSN